MSYVVAARPVDTTQADLRQAAVLDDLGQPAAAVREIDRVLPALAGLPRARARLQRAVLLRRLGREDEALAGCAAALSTFRRAGDRLWQAHALTNRAALRTDRGALGVAERDLLRAEALYAELGQPVAVARVWHNLGFLAVRAGDLPSALSWYDRADEYLGRRGRPTEALLDRAEVLLLARLWPEALEVATTAARSAARARRESLVPQARLLQAQAALAAGYPARARVTAAAARAAFRRQGHTRDATLADYVVWRAGVGPEPDPAAVATAGELGTRLAGAGWAEHALEAWIYAVEAAAVLVAQRPADAATIDGSAGTGTAVGELRQAVARVPRGPARLRARVWYGRALIRLYDGDRRGAKRALAAALRVVDAYRDTIGAAELRANVTAEGTHSATLGLRLALADGDAAQVLAWAERSRAAALRLPGPTVPAETGRYLVELRQLATEISTMDTDSTRLARLRRRQRELEEAVRHIAWRTPACGKDSASAPRQGFDLRAAGRPSGSNPRRRDGTPDRIQAGGKDSARGGTLAAIRARLGERALVELVQLDGAVGAVVVADGRVVLRHLGRADEITAEAMALRFALRRLALRHGAARSRDAARATARHAAHRLDELLFAPLRALVGDRPLVVVPTGDLHRLPWPLLATCRGRPLQVAPSAGQWWAATVQARRPGHVLLVAPATPPHAAAEVARIGQAQPEATLLTGSRARVGDVLAAMDGARVAHLAAHGHFRADNPLFSQLALADGPLTGHDLFQLRRPPGLLVLSACEAGLATVRDGDELTGFTSAVLGLGTRAVVASVGPVDDEATATLMVDLHQRLRDGVAPAEALALAQVATATDPHATTYGFVCFGAG